MSSPDAVREAIVSLPEAERIAALKAALITLPDDAQKEVVSAAVLPPPPKDSPTSNYLWRTVVTAFAGVLVLCVAALVLGMFNKAEGPVEPELLLSVITSLIGFLAGIFVPAPAGGSGQEGARE